VPDATDLPTARFAALLAPVIERLHTGVHVAAGAIGCDGGPAVAVRDRYGLPDLGFHLTLRLALPIRPVPVAAVAALLRYFPDPGDRLRREIDQQVQAGLIIVDGDTLIATDRCRHLLDELTACYQSAVARLWGDDRSLPGLIELWDRLIAAAEPGSGGLFAALIPPDQPADASPGLALFNQLGAVRCHRADAHVAAWTSAGLTAAQIKAMAPGPERDRIEDDTNARAGVLFAELTPQQRLDLLAALARLRG